MRSLRVRRRLTASVVALLLAGTSGRAQERAAAQLQPNLADNTERPWRYQPDGGKFFNRPLYGGNTAFRVDAGDQPEFALYLPAGGGNLRLGLRTVTGAKWWHEAITIEARYLPGEMIYEICDPLLGAAGVIYPTRELKSLTIRAIANDVVIGLMAATLER